MSGSEHLTPKQEDLILALMSTTTVAKAAEKAGCSERTAYRYMKLPHFREALEEARRNVHDQALALLAQNATAAAETLVRNLNNSDNPHAEIRAADRILSHTQKARENAIEDRLRALEEFLRGAGGNE